MKEEEIVTSPLKIREKMTIHLVIFLIKVVKPFNWSHEVDNCFKEVLECMKEESKGLPDK